MKTCVLFGSSRGSTRQVTKALKDHLTFSFDVVDVKTRTDAEFTRDYDLLLFLAPTYGDEELQEDMEAFLQYLPADMGKQYFAACELGNYYGYDDFTYGAVPIMRRELLARGCREWSTPVSVDSLPKKDWDVFARWCTELEKQWQISTS